jgi:hypothetical protein
VFNNNKVPITSLNNKIPNNIKISNKIEDSKLEIKDVN